jgi:membrane protease YdiL (CAAX protease family)
VRVGLPKRAIGKIARRSQLKMHFLYKTAHLDLIGALTKRKAWLTIEFLTLYVGFPLAFHTFLHSYSPVPFMGLFGIIATVYLIKSPNFSNRTFLNFRSFYQDLPRVLGVFLGSAVLIFAFVWLNLPEYLFYCPRNHPAVWGNILWSYPLLAVYPQEIIYRGFLFQRYGELFSDQKYITHASALVFSFGHIIYYNPYSMLLTLVGGYFFANTYQRTRSLFAASFEHALYGCFLYTIGLGRFFFTGIDQLIK